MVTNQMYLFLIFIVDGILIGLLFDFFRIARKVFQTSDVMTYVEDILFWILTGFIVLYSIFVFNNGELRLFMFLGILLGAFIYMLWISSYIIKINVKIINFIKKVLSIILTPFHFVFINIRKSFTNFYIKIGNLLKKSKKEKNIVKNWKKMKDFFKICRIYNYDIRKD